MKRFFDIGVNLGGEVFGGNKYHRGDVLAVVDRARAVGVSRMMITSSLLADSREAMEIARATGSVCTVGIHPCQAAEGGEDPEGYVDQVVRLARAGAAEGVVAAFGEMGLDYDRLHFASKETQLQCFRLQMARAREVGLPLFLHMRNALDDFVAVMEPHLGSIQPSVVHSFTGTLDELQRVLLLGFYVSVNGCGLRLEENLEVVKHIPLDRLMLETDAPWCELRPSSAAWKYLSATGESPAGTKSHPFLPFPLADKKKVGKMQEAGVDPMVKGRNEPAGIVLVAQAVAGAMGLDVDVVTEAAWQNSVRVFGAA